MTDEELDRRLADLGGIEPPRALQADILRAVGVSDVAMAETLGEAPAPASGPSSWGRGAEPPRNAPPRGGELVPLRARRVALVATGIVALAAALLLTVRAPEGPADPARLVPRGVGEAVPAFGLRVAVRSGGTLERLAVGKPYRAGDTLVFRVSAQTPMDIVLRRDDVVLYRGPVPAGETDLPVGYALEAGEGPARFTVEGGGATDAVTLPGVLP